MNKIRIFIYITFLGIILHEISHYLMCKLLGLHVEEIKLLDIRRNGKLGYVIHEKPSNFIKSVLVSTSPFLINHIAGFLLLFYSIKMQSSILIFIVSIFISFSLFFHAIPSMTDIKNLIPTRLIHFLNPFLYLFAPFILFLLLVHKFSKSIKVKIISNSLIVLISILLIKFLNEQRIIEAYRYIQSFI